MRVYSGECEIGICGGATSLHDSRGAMLEVGDIVVLFHAQEESQSVSMSVIAEDRASLYGGDQDGKPFVMGLKSVDINHSEEWIVVRVKRWQDVVKGERWTSHGFNYRGDPND